jgi:alpha-L-glutamate ligase-like protein
MNQRNAQCILDLNPRQYFPLVDGKRNMRELCRSIGVPTPELFGVIPTHSALRHLNRLLANRSDFVVKPSRGAGGRGILVITGRDGAEYLRHNGERLSAGDIRQHVSSIISGLFSLGGQGDEALIQQRVVADTAFAGITYQGAADIRIIVYKKQPVMAMLRLPTRASGGRANLHQGAIGAGVDLATGVTTRAVFRNRLINRHPDTGENVVGFRVPFWSAIVRMARRVSEAVHLGYLGVDIVVDQQAGPLVLEANARPGLAIQIANGRGLLACFAEVDRYPCPS